MIKQGVFCSAFLDKAHIIRVSKDDLKKEFISIDLREALKDNPEHNLELKWMDKVIIFNLSDMIPDYTVSINGHVKRPGRYALMDEMTLYDLIFQYGGFRSRIQKRTYSDRAELVRISRK